MLLYEVHEYLRCGFGVVLRPGRAGVPLGFDGEASVPQYLPLGHSIDGLLKHPEDAEENFRLHWGALDEKTSGLCLVHQTETEARADRKALVLVDGCVDEELGVTTIEQARGRPMPELITYTQDSSMRRALYLFNEGEALYVCWTARSLDAKKPRRFVITWDGEQLRLLQRASRPWTPRHSMPVPREETLRPSPEHRARP